MPIFNKKLVRAIYMSQHAVTDTIHSFYNINLD